MTTSIVTLAFILLIGHFISEFFIFKVLKRQWALLKVPIYPEVKSFRRVLFMLSLVVFFGNFIPIIIDGLTLFINTGRPAHVKPISVAYAMSNMIVALCSAYLIHTLYKLARSTPEITKFENSQLSK